jgi:hypothetical protein
VYFTDSQVQQLYFVPIGKKGALGELQRIPITGDFVYGAGFNANGIEKAKGGKTLILVKSSDPGKLYTADAATGRHEGDRARQAGHQRRRAAAQGPQALRRPQTATTSCASCGSRRT